MRGCAISFLMRASVALSDSFLGFLMVPMSTLQWQEEALLTLPLNIIIEAAKTRVCSILHSSGRRSRNQTRFVGAASCPLPVGMADARAPTRGAPTSRAMTPFDDWRRLGYYVRLPANPN